MTSLGKALAVEIFVVYEIQFKPSALFPSLLVNFPIDLQL